MSFFVNIGMSNEQKIISKNSSNNDPIFKRASLHTDKKEQTLFKDIKLKYNKSAVLEHYKKWKKFNTEIYVYSCVCSSPTLKCSPTILFIQDKKIVKSISLPQNVIEKFPSFNTINDFNITKSRPEKSRHPTLRVKDIVYNSLEEKFDLALNIYHKYSHYYNYAVDIEYDKNHSYISAIKVSLLVDKKLIPKYTTPWSVYSYGLLMLPKNTEFTDDVVNEILEKHNKAWKCEKKLLAINSRKKEQNLTMLEEAVGKERLECLDKYLVWDKNESK